jgi:flagellin-like protein
MDSRTVVRRGRAQVGIGALIVFIAIVLVAAIAAGVLLHTGGVQQNRAQQTGEGATNQVSGGLVVVSAYGHVTGEVKDDPLNKGVDVMPNESVDTVSLTVKLSSGSSAVNLSRTTISCLGPEREATLVHGGTASHAPGVVESSEPGTFGLQPKPGGGGGGGRRGGAGGSAPGGPDAAFNTYAVAGDDHTTLTEQEDRITIYLNAGLIEANTDNARTPRYSDPLPAGSEVTLQITTSSGSTTPYRLTVPPALTEEGTVTL